MSSHPKYGRVDFASTSSSQSPIKAPVVDLINSLGFQQPKQVLKDAKLRAMKLRPAEFSLSGRMFTPKSVLRIARLCQSFEIEGVKRTRAKKEELMDTEETFKTPFLHEKDGKERKKDLPPRIIVEGQEPGTVLEWDEEEIIILRPGEKPEDRPPILQRKKCPYVAQNVASFDGDSDDSMPSLSRESSLSPVGSSSVFSD